MKHVCAPYGAGQIHVAEEKAERAHAHMKVPSPLPCHTLPRLCQNPLPAWPVEFQTDSNSKESPG